MLCLLLFALARTDCAKDVDENYVVPRRSSFPFISGDTFREFADVVLDESGCRIRTMHDPVVFVKTDFEAIWFTTYHHKFDSYTLITGNSDYSVPHTQHGLNALDQIKWFTINRVVDHPNLFAIPLGTNNVGRPNGFGFESFDRSENELSKRWKKSFERTFDSNKAVAIYFNTETNPLRNEALRCLRQNGFAAFPPMPYNQTMREISKFHFVASPPGNGIDCVRTYESIMRGAIPIVFPSTTRWWSNLPHLEVESFCDVTTDFLRKAWYRLRTRPYDFSTAYAPYWYNLIRPKRKAEPNVT